MKKAVVATILCFMMLVTCVASALTSEEMMQEAEKFLKYMIETYESGPILLCDADTIQELHGALLMYEGAYNITMGDKSIGERLYSSDDKVRFNDMTKKKESIRSRKVMNAYETYISWLMGDISDEEYVESVIPILRYLLE